MNDLAGHPVPKNIRCWACNEPCNASFENGQWRYSMTCGHDLAVAYDHDKWLADNFKENPMAETDSQPFTIPDRIAIDAKGYGWRVWEGEDHWSMVPTNPDNSPIPEPVAWFVPKANFMKVADLKWCVRHHCLLSQCDEQDCEPRQVFIEKVAI